MDVSCAMCSVQTVMRSFLADSDIDWISIFELICIFHAAQNWILWKNNGYCFDKWISIVLFFNHETQLIFCYFRFHFQLNERNVIWRSWMKNELPRQRQTKENFSIGPHASWNSRKQWCVLSSTFFSSSFSCANRSRKKSIHFQTSICHSLTENLFE